MCAIEDLVFKSSSCCPAQNLLGADIVKVTSDKDFEEDQEVHNTRVPGEADDDTHSDEGRDNEVRLIEIDR